MPLKLINLFFFFFRSSKLPFLFYLVPFFFHWNFLLTFFLYFYLFLLTFFLSLSYPPLLPSLSFLLVSLLLPCSLFSPFNFLLPFSLLPPFLFLPFSLYLYLSPILLLLLISPSPTSLSLSDKERECVDPITCACVDPCLLQTGHVWAPSSPLIRDWPLSQQADGLFLMRFCDSQHWPLCTPLELYCLMTLRVVYSEDRWQTMMLTIATACHHLYLWLCTEMRDLLSMPHMIFI